MSNDAEKKETAERIMRREGEVILTVNLSALGVVVPDHLRGKEWLNLRWGKDLEPAIENLVINRHGISGVLAFGGNKHLCVVPWKSVFGAHDSAQRGCVWLADAPAAVAAKVLAEAAEREQKKTRRTRKTNLWN